MPKDVRQRLVRPPVHPNKKDGVAHDPFPARSSGLERSSMSVAMGRSNAAFCIAVYRWVGDVKLGLPNRDWAWWSEFFMSILQLGVAAIPWGLHNNWNIFIATAAGTVIAYASASLPQWQIKNWTPERRMKDIAITQGNSNQHVIVILGADHGFDMEAPAAARSPKLGSTRIYSSTTLLRLETT
jgi:hypothetical protein